MIYKVRVILDTKEDVFRDIEIKGKQTLWNLHEAIRSAFSLQGDELSVFNLFDEDGAVLKSVPLEDMSDEGDGEIMSDVYIDEVFQQEGDKLQFQYGLLDLWEFFCELIGTAEGKSAVNYPVTVFRFGSVPLKAPAKSTDSTLLNKTKSEDFDLDEEFYGEDFDDDDDFDDADFSDDFYDDDEI
ncbi:hypothetical protein IMZ16_09950 [Cruoricaptor ignavus]|uniref:Plasmid pRiA4b Orf3-like domain-containing protein n=1 Tax=Cruoricaptor ignavus TaxID=1118202 RepID=A0A7M1T224_9FLAO|nr:hypothetical protein [Cruoricaptor ignavus]QOR73811.1 hypothetical protein IMZ16_09950 [Cruoricaptor ignavus]